MAEAVVDFVYHKLQDAMNGPVKEVLSEEGQFLYGVNDKAAGVQRELGEIKRFLKDADSRSSSDEQVRNWVKEVRNVAYSIEDAVDTFQAEVDWINYKEPGFINYMKKSFKKPTLLPALQQLGSEMDNLQARIKKINESKTTMGVNSLNDGSSGNSSLPIRRLIRPELGEIEMDVVGFESDKANIIGEIDSITTSYKHLPLHLKSCFMSLSVFPEDYEINARSLISYWSIEGFIPQDGSGTMDEKAQGYLDELVQRCMVQVTAKTSTGIIERCRVHTLHRNLAVHEAKEKDFITIFSKQEDNQQKETARHASFHDYEPKMQSNSTKNKDVIDYTGPKVRTLMFFDKILPIHNRMKLLKVLIAYNTNVTFYDGKHTWLENLMSLRHLEFRKCELEKDTLPEIIGCLRCLEYLDLTDTKIVDLPNSIKCNETLKLVGLEASLH